MKGRTGAACGYAEGSQREVQAPSDRPGVESEWEPLGCAAEVGVDRCEQGCREVLVPLGPRGRLVLCRSLDTWFKDWLTN
jgi:hypothetical protein